MGRIKKIFEGIKGFFNSRKQMNSVIANYNYRRQIAERDGVDTKYLDENLKKAGIEFTAGGQISTKNLTEEGMRALEANYPEKKVKGRYNYTEYAKEVQEERKWKEEERLAGLQEQVAIQNYKDAMRERVEEMLAAYYGSDKKNKRRGGSYENNINYKKMSDEHQIKFSEEIVAVGTAVANETMTEEEFEEYLDRWAKWAGIGSREAYQ